MGEVTREINWGGNHTYRAAEVVRPTSLDDLGAIVRSSPQVAAIGTRHSFNAIGDADTIIDLSTLDVPIAVDDETGTVSLSPATTYADLCAVLAARGRAVHNLASLPHISVGGAISTGTHGSGSRLGNLATAVHSVDLLSADGAVRRYRCGDPDFDGVVVSLGALGLMTRIELRTQPAFTVTQTVYDGLDWLTLTADFDALFGAATSVSVFTRWGDDVGEMWCKQRDDDATQAPFDLRTLRPAAGMRHPIPGADPSASTQQLGRSGPWWNRLPHFRADAMPSTGNEIQSECFVDRADSASAIDALRSIGRALDPALLVSEIRTVAADEFWMSPHHGRDSTGFHFTFQMDQVRAQHAVDSIASALADVEVRFHPSKMLPTDWRIESPRRGDYLDLKRRLDPHDRFTTDWFRSHIA